MSRRHAFDLEDLTVFAEVARTGSFTAAAGALHYTQSGVSRRIATLEAAVGLPLFTRVARGVRTTAVGDGLLRHADEVLARADLLASELDAFRQGTGGRLRIGAFSTANASLVPTALDTFQRERPDVVTTVTEALTPQLLDDLRSGTLDCAVVSDYPLRTVDSRAVTLTPLLDDPVLVALPRHHPLAGRPRLALRDLCDERWIAAGPTDDTTVLEVAAREAGFRPRADIRVASWTAKLSFVAAGLGVTLVPGLMAAALRPDLVLKPLSAELPPRCVFVALPSDVEPLPSAQRFVELLVATT
jgi:DNA-binding transcriptional LysR family regulator